MTGHRVCDYDHELSTARSLHRRSGGVTILRNSHSNPAKVSAHAADLMVPPFAANAKMVSWTYCPISKFNVMSGEWQKVLMSK